MDRQCGCHGGEQICTQIFLQKILGKNSLGRAKSIWDLCIANIKGFRSAIRGATLDKQGHGQGAAVECMEHRKA